MEAGALLMLLQTLLRLPEADHRDELCCDKCSGATAADAGAACFVSVWRFVVWMVQAVGCMSPSSASSSNWLKKSASALGAWLSRRSFSCTWLAASRMSVASSGEAGAGGGLWAAAAWSLVVAGRCSAQRCHYPSQ